MAVNIQLGADIVWGTTGAAPGTIIAALGKVLSCDSKSTAKMFEQPDEDDELYGLVVYDQREEVTLEVLARAAAVKPAPGDILECAGVTTLICKDSSVKWAVGATKKISISAFATTA